MNLAVKRTKFGIKSLLRLLIIYYNLLFKAKFQRPIFRGILKGYMLYGSVSQPLFLDTFAFFGCVAKLFQTLTLSLWYM
jgi:hypothetical protein